MSLNSTLRKINSANKKAVRNAEKRRRELERQRKAQAKLDALEAARFEVDLFENRLEVLRSIHIDANEQIDWQGVLDSPPPFAIGSSGPNELQATDNYRNYKPGMMDKLFNRAEVYKQKLAEEIEVAKKLDKEELSTWEEQKSLAEKVLLKDTDYFLTVIEDMAPFSDIKELGSSYLITVIDNETVEIDIFVHSEEVIPNEIKSLTSTGKVSKKKMPIGQYNELYQDYVCGVAIRSARELLALLPVENVIVNALADQLDSSTGHMRSEVVLSVFFPRDTLELLNFQHIDCSDAMNNFEHRMDFTKKYGFMPVDKINIG